VDFLPLLLLALSIGVTVALTALAARLASLLTTRILAQSPPVAAVGARRLVWIIVWLIGGTIALQLAGVSPEILLLVVALLGAAGLLSLRYALENFGAKFFSDVYIPYKIGDSIRVGDAAGKVIEINAMATVLLSAEDQLISIPNVVFLRQMIVNTSPQAWKEVVVPVTVRSSVDLPAFESALLKSLSKLRVRLDPRFPPVLTTKARGTAGTDLVLTLMIRRPEDRDALMTEAAKRVAEVLSASESGGRRAA
jgi:small conductance mechanosensitive channel